MAKMDKVKNIYRDSEGKAPSQFKGEAEGFDMCLKMLKEKGIRITEHTWQSDLPIQVFRLITDPMTKKIKRGVLCFIEDDAQPTIRGSHVPHPRELLKKIEHWKRYLSNLEDFIREIHKSNPPKGSVIKIQRH